MPVRQDSGAAPTLPLTRAALNRIMLAESPPEIRPGLQHRARRQDHPHCTDVRIADPTMSAKGWPAVYAPPQPGHGWVIDVMEETQPQNRP